MALGSAARQIINLIIDDDNGIPLSSEVPGPSRQVINLIIEDDNDDNNNDGDEVVEIR